MLNANDIQTATKNCNTYGAQIHDPKVGIHGHNHQMYALVIQDNQDFKLLPIDDIVELNELHDRERFSSNLVILSWWDLSDYGRDSVIKYTYGFYR